MDSSGRPEENRGEKGVTAWRWQPFAHAGTLVSSKDVLTET